jgi:hypothetical protein
MINHNFLCRDIEIPNVLYEYDPGRPIKYLNILMDKFLVYASILFTVCFRWQSFEIHLINQRKWIRIINDKSWVFASLILSRTS